jgi:hypothetical protein
MTDTEITLQTETAKEKTEVKKDRSKEYRRMLDAILSLYIESGFADPSFRDIFSRLEPETWKEIEAYVSEISTRLKEKSVRAEQRSVDLLFSKLTPNQIELLKNKLLQN